MTANYSQHMKTQPYYAVRTSRIHGRGVFANKAIRKGTKVIEYTGPIVSREEADEIGAQTENGHSHTMLFQIDKERVINGNEGGDARYINHSCDPNCEAVQYGDKIFIESVKSIAKGTELVYDYHLQVPGKITDKVKKEYACFCGSPKCRGTQIAPEILEKQAKKDEKKRHKEELKKLKSLKKEQKKLKGKAKADKKKSKADAKVEKKKAKKDKKAKADKKKPVESKSSKSPKSAKKDKKAKSNKKKAVESKSSKSSKSAKKDKKARPENKKAVKKGK